MVEAPLELQSSLEIPPNHYEVCRDSNVKTSGNAAGNTVDLFNLEGQNESLGPLPSGFTARGIVALVFSVVAAFLGMATITWYVLLCSSPTQPFGSIPFLSSRTCQMATRPVSISAGH